MTRSIAILRGINVGGKRIIRMEDLKSMFQEIGLENVETYIQSGNVLFDSKKDKSDSEIQELIEQAIFKKYGFEVPVIVRSVKELHEAVNNNPFYNEKSENIERLHLTFLKETPTSENLEKTESYNYEPDKFVIREKQVFIYCQGKYHQTKLNNNFFEKKLKTSATTRNWKTVLKLIELGKD